MLNKSLRNSKLLCLLGFNIHVGKIMSIDAIKNIQTNIFSSKSKTSFTSNPEVQSENNNTGKALLIAGLTALGAVGIYITTRGKKGSSTITEGTQKPAEPIAEQIKELTLDAFRQAGNKLEKGRAKFANGENYTGTLVQETKDAKKLVLQYNNGRLEKAEKLDLQTWKKLYTKKYIYSESNKERLSTVKKDDNVIFQRYGSGVQLSNGYCGQNIDKSRIFVRSDNGVEKHYEFVNGKRILRAECKADNPSTLIFYKDDGTREFALRNCSTTPNSCDSGTRWNGTVELYDNSGEFIKLLEKLDDPNEYFAYKHKYVEWFKNMS